MTADAKTKLVYRRPDVLAALGISNTVLKQWLASRKFPQPDVWLGKRGAWKAETVRRWVDSGGTGRAER